MFNLNYHSHTVDNILLFKRIILLLKRSAISDSRTISSKFGNF